MYQQPAGNPPSPYGAPPPQPGQPYGAPPQQYAPPPGQPPHAAPTSAPYPHPGQPAHPEGEKSGYAVPQQPIHAPPQYSAPPQQAPYGAPSPHQGQHQPYGAPPQQPHSPYPAPAPQFAAPSSAGVSNLGPATGEFQGARYEIMYRDCNTMVKFTLQPNVTINAVAGSMVAHSANVKLEGKMKLKNMFTPGETFSQTLTAHSHPGEVYVAPDMYADVICLDLNGRDDWIIGGGFLASTIGVKKSTNVQGIGKAFFSGEGLFVTRLSGQGIAFVSSLGAIHPIDLAPGQEYVIDNGHLVA
ncbi:hypothetical protein HK097_001319, partial [Rhizophlyctis rosea]